MREVHGHNKPQLLLHCSYRSTGRISSSLCIIVDGVNESLAVKSRDRKILLRNDSAPMKLGNNFYGFIYRTNGVFVNGRGILWWSPRDAASLSACDIAHDIKLFYDVT